MGYSKQFIEYLADFICGDNQDKYPKYRSGSELTDFFQNIDIKVPHDGTTRRYWVRGVLENLQQNDIELVIKTLVSPILYFSDQDKLRLAVKSMNELLQYENRKIKFEGQVPTIVYHKSTIEDLLNEKPSESKPLASQNSRDFSPNIIGNNNQVHIHIMPQDAKISRLFNELTNMAKTIQ